MCAIWIKEQRSEQLVNSLLVPVKNQFHPDAKGGVFGSNFHAFHDLVTAILSFVAFHDEIPETEKFQLMSGAVWSAAKANKLDARSLLGQLTKKENEYFDQPFADFEFASSLSVRYFSKLNRSRLNPPIKFFGKIPPKLDFASITERFSYIRPIPESYAFIRIPVKARTPAEAFHLGSEALDLMRAIWNWLYFPVENPLMSYAGRPLNHITTGPLHAIIDPAGQLADGIWYEHEFREISVDISRDWEKINKYERNSRRSFKRHPYGKDIEKYLRRFTRSLDYLDKQISFSKLWQVMEKLTDTNNADYERMIKRVVFLYGGDELHKAILNHLRQYRNSSVHDDHQGSMIETYLFQLLRYVKQLFVFHLKNPFRAKTLSEAVSYLDESTDIGALSKKIAKMQKVLKFQTK